MIDNVVSNGSIGEGTLELHTFCNVESLIGFNSVPINPDGGLVDYQVIITGITVSQGNVFTAAGQPRQQQALPNDPLGFY